MPDLHPTAEETALIAPDVTLSMSDGARIPLRIYPAAHPLKAVILALHGFGDSRDAWEFFAPPLSAAGIEIVAPDQRGFGATQDAGGWSSTARMVEDTREELAWLHGRYPDLPLYVMGESMGGAVALLLATDPPPKLSGTILLAPAIMKIGEPWQTVLDGLDTVAPQWKLDGSAVPGERVASDNIYALRRMYFDPLTQHSSTIHPLSGLTHLMAAAFDAAPRIRTPMLMVFGGRDQFVLPPYTARFLKRLPASVRLDEFPTAHHLISRDKRITAQDVASWILTPDRALPSGGDIAAALWKATAQP
ncbi:alpha/beta hydrolase [Gluconobacter frateurii]|uniref:Lysophospholipase n=1 Tax=Gluconobacter frateurii NRIC 0228 TaxID=1307946 RepID=A0ABQ0QAD5_9PROT|nr:alpha/beta fold hydrolase [Gluconobacter frateurii]GBR10825.1 lysophospholipase [Gluconobacter frateurii NRIC 0228]GLP91453.1 alpha/beta hydrolase [Gluconobacter frateurii]